MAKWPGLQGFHRDFHGPDEELRAFDARDRDDGIFGDVRAGLAPRRPENAVDADGAGGAQVVDRLGDEGLAADEPVCVGARMFWRELLAQDDREYYDKMSKAVNPYGDGCACKRFLFLGDL